jgi:hypothetical protein
LDSCEKGVETLGTDELKKSSGRIGQLYPVLVDYYGRIVDGEHRIEADKAWYRKTLGHIKTEKDWLVARIISNNVRRTVPQREKRLLLKRLGEVLLDEGTPRGRIAYRIAEETGMSYRWVMKYLPTEFKDERQSARASAAARCAATALDDFLRPPRKKGSVILKSYANADFVSLTIEKRFYEEFEGNSMALGFSAEASLLKALEDYNDKMKRALQLKTGGRLGRDKHTLLHNVSMQKP